MALTDIANRLTPSTPLEFTFGAMPIAGGKKIATLFCHVAATGSLAVPYSKYSVVNVSDPVAAQNEVNLIAGAGSEAGAMAASFVLSNSAIGGSNFPSFQIVFLPNGETAFGPNQEAITACMTGRSDFLVSPYPADNTAANQLLATLAATLSGPDRNLMGQFGTFAQFASLSPLNVVDQIVYNSNKVMIETLPDSNTGSVTPTGNTTIGSNLILGLSSMVGIYAGASISGTGIPSNTTITQVSALNIQLSQNATAAGTGVTLTIQNKVSQPVSSIAAAAAATKLASPFPYFSLNGVQCGGLIPPQITTDWIQVNPNGQSEVLLKAGLSPLIVKPGGVVTLLRTRTNYTLASDGVTAINNYFDWQQLQILNDFREETYQLVQQPQFQRSKASLNTAALLKDEVIALAQDFEDRGAFQGVQALAPQFQIAPSTSDPARFDFFIPVNVLANLNVIAGNIQAVSTFNFTA